MVLLIERDRAVEMRANGRINLRLGFAWENKNSLIDLLVFPTVANIEGDNPFGRAIVWKSLDRSQIGPNFLGRLASQRGPEYVNDRRDYRENRQQPSPNQRPKGIKEMTAFHATPSYPDSKIC
jgi:hypothetical protein